MIFTRDYDYDGYGCIISGKNRLIASLRDPSQRGQKEEYRRLEEKRLGILFPIWS